MAEPRSATSCPACGGELTPEFGSLCPRCLVELALESPSLMAELEDAEEPPTLGLTDFEDGEDAPTLSFAESQPFAEGRIHGERYRIRSLLGTGGMGEVWRAYDLKLRLDVALKALRAELIADPQALEGLRQEVRIAREVVSPNVCRVFDLQELDGQELVSMEYVDGTTLQDILKRRGPLELNEAREIASQLLAGLEAIHAAGLVHRDIKPENVMITRTGRVVVMDFGIAKALQEGEAGAIAGTPAYMSPEQAQGQELDPRADLFSAGVLLAEMVEPAGVGSFEKRRSVWEGIHQSEPVVAPTPWSKVIARAVAADREARFASATALARALEEVTLRAAGDEDAHPYPGLASFQKDDAEYFFGRELEVEALWKRLRRPQMRAVIGPSGAGKSSFLRAGLLASLPESWSVVLAQPGNRPFAALARALAEILPSDQATVDALARFEEPEAAIGLISSWRQQHEHTLIVLDQFEELFTQNPAQVQAAFAELLGRLPLEADVHVLLSMRDDFLFHCQAFEPLAPIFSELTPIGAPTGAALRRAIVQPALKCGYRFEEESLVEEMLGEVEGERGSLPMVAFAAAKLWQLRDRDQGLLTRQAYERIGGVGGALAQHAEATLEGIGADQIPIVRELFRNLVTAEGTRAARDRNDLLSVFVEHAATETPERRRPFGEGGAWSGEATEPEGPASPPGGLEAAARVLDALIDARLLTSYEVPGAEGEARRTQIEIVHESLLSNWPRLVRWRTQDADSAQLRDQLRQAAQAWVDRGRPTDLLWSGTSYQEYGLWRQRYPGGLTSAEEEFGQAMTAHAERRTRRRRMAIAAAFVLLLIGLSVVGFFWRQSVAQAHRAEANQLLSLGQIAMETNPTATLAYARASLELVDSREARLLALESLWRGPPATVLEGTESEQIFFSTIDFSPDGNWLAAADDEGNLKLWSRKGGPARVLGTEEGHLRNIRFGPDSKTLAARTLIPSSIRLWSIPDGEVQWSETSEYPVDMRLVGDRLFIFTQEGPLTRITSRPLEGGDPVSYGRLDAGQETFSNFIHEWNLDVDRTGNWLAFPAWIPGTRAGYGSEGGLATINLIRLDALETSEPRRMLADQPVFPPLFHPDGQHLITGWMDGKLRIYSLQDQSGEVLRVLQQPPGWVRALRFDATATWLASASLGSCTALWNLEAPVSATGTILSRHPASGHFEASFDPSGEWLATAELMGATLWPIDDRYPRTLRGHEQQVNRVAFHPSGKWLASTSADGSLKLWPLTAGLAESERTLFRVEGNQPTALSIDRSGEKIAVGSAIGQVWVVSVETGSPLELISEFQGGITATAFSHDGNLVAAAGGVSRGSDAVVRVWNLESGESQVLDAGDQQRFNDLEFSPDGRLISASLGGLRIWDLTSGTSQLLDPRETFDIELGPEGRSLYGSGRASADGKKPDGVILYDLDIGESRQLSSHRDAGMLAVGFGERLVASKALEGPLRVSRVGFDSAYLIFHQEPIGGLAISPDSRWIAAPSQSEILLWPTPDFSQPPLQTLPLKDLLTKLDSLTNFRVIRDSNATTGWRLAVEPFPGWEEKPEW